MKLKLCAASVLLLMLAACSSTSTTHHQRHNQRNDGPATLEDLDDVRVYRPRDTGRDTSGRFESDDPEVHEPGRESPSSEIAPVAGPEESPVGPPSPVAEVPPEEPEPVVEQPNPVDEDPGDDSPDPVVEDPGEDPEPVTGPDHGELADAFIADVKSRLSELKATKAWKAYTKAIEDFDKRYDKAKEKRGNDKGKDLEQAWAATIKAWYEARYFQALFLHLNEGPGDFEPVFIHDREEVLALDAEHLQNQACINAQAASELVADRNRQLTQFQTDVLKYDRTAADVFADKKWEKRWEDEKQKWQDAANGKFDDKDIRKYSE